MNRPFLGPIVPCIERVYRRKAMRFIVILAAVFLVPALAGCSGSAPYVFKEGEFDRGSPNFGQEPSDIDSLVICYNKGGTTPRALVKMAQGECSKFNKSAVYNHQDYNKCPMLTPVAIYFDCLDTQGAYQ